MINIGICDDDKNIIKKMKDCINDYKKSDFSITAYNSGEELIKEKKKFHVLFLDIDMSGINGIDTAKIIRSYDKDVKIIYVTSFTDYVNLAFQVHAFGYLNKPIKKEEIYNQINEVIAYTSPKEEEMIEFLTDEGRIRIRTTEIYYFEYNNRKVNIKTKNKQYKIKEKITDIAKVMKKYGFEMPHKSFTVNLFHVKYVKGYDICMMDGSSIPLSQKKSVEFREELNKYLEKCI
ncbi:LytR/AlgR family response regulator transcription factor [Clostridium sp.]|uniref:LytR/AlgR family response regulator transcription factor n=1 Tax=Clostridium sp. TaxID=1506 RepID=UPI002FC6F6AA